jgi:MbtH protein
MSNPFERDDISYHVLVNDEGQYSLWPELIAIPAGWRVVFGAAPREECLSYVEVEWTDIRPASLVADMTEHGR